ncbi:MAG: PAS domain S-box protein, partial [Acidobacteriota bacterium]
SAALPIRVHEQVAGALSVYAGEAGAFDPEVVALLEELAADLGYALAGIETEKLRADAATALAASEANYRRIVETASEGIWAMNADLRTTFVNRCAAAMLGFDPGEMLGRAYEEFMFPDQLADHEARMTERRRGETGLYERRFRRKDGGECWCIVSATALRDGEGRFAGSFAMLTDITGRKRAEAALADSEERLRLALEASGQGMFDWDIATGRIAWSEGHERLWGLEPGTFDGSFETFRRGVHPDDIAELEAALGAARASRSAYAHEFRVVRPDGSRRWVFGSGRFYYDRAGAPVRMCGVVTDVTARHEAEAALHEADRRRAEILESVTDGFVALDLESRYTYVNTRAGEMIGRRPEELLGRHIWTVFPEGVGQPIHQALERALATQEPAQIEAYFEPWDRWFENRIYPSAAGLTVYFVETTERRRAEQRLAEAEERHKLALEGGGLGSWDWNVVTGAVVFNERWAEMLGYTLDEIEPDVTVWEGLLHPDDRQRVAEVLEAHLRGETPHYETEHRLRHKTGGWVWVLDRGRVIERDAHGRALRACGTHLDITERRRAEQRLRESEERLRFALEASHVGGWDLDLVDHTAFRTLEHDRIFGYRTLLPKWTYEMFLDHVVPEDRAEVDRCFREATAAGTNWHFECRIRRVDDEVRWIWATGEHRLDGAGNVRRMAGIVQDITERKRAEEAQRTLAEQLERRVRDRTAELAANQAALEREVEERRWTQLALERAKSEVEDLYNRAPCGYHSLDEGGRIVAINDTELEWLGRGREDVVGTLRFQDLLTPASREVFAANFPGFKERGWVRDLEFELVRADGSTFWVLLNASAIRDQLGRYVASRSTTFDITAKKAVEDRARQLALLAQQRATELEAANAELEAFAYSVSHDLRAPLRAIDGFSLALLEDSAAQLDEAGRGHLERVRAATQRMGRLIDDLLRLSRVTRHDLQRGPVDLARLAREVIAELAAQEPGRRVDVTVAGEMAADADPHLMRILLVNLLGNAWKFTARVEEPAIAFTVARHPGAVPAYSVSDNGAGFDPAYAQRLFQPFQRLHGATEFPGSGIGLATAQRIVRRHGGRIWAVSEVGRGATFSFTLEPDAAALGAGMGVG